MRALLIRRGIKLIHTGTVGLSGLRALLIRRGIKPFSLYSLNKEGFVRDDFVHEQYLVIRDGNKRILLS
ncbi:MAG: hypothetical protein K6E98_13025, partial [Lachnospiraceae bacterium]|nr:hypothetical protein [Lachnospiraceae bacterium]